MVHNHRVYKSMWSLVIEQLALEKEPVGQSTRHICSTWDSQTADRTLSEIDSHVKTRDEGALLSAVRCLSYYWDKEERKRLRSSM